MNQVGEAKRLAKLYFDIVRVLAFHMGLEKSVVCWEQLPVDHQEVLISAARVLLALGVSTENLAAAEGL